MDCVLLGSYLILKLISQVCAVGKVVAAFLRTHFVYQSVVINVIELLLSVAGNYSHSMLTYSLPVYLGVSSFVMNYSALCSSLQCRSYLFLSVYFFFSESL